jgi:organic radical activating enzyme
MSDVALCVALSGPTLEPTGAHAGRACVVIRFAAKTDRDAKLLAIEDVVREVHRLDTVRSYRIVVTGAEAAERWTDALAVPLRRAGYRIHLESAGTHVPAGAIDWHAITPSRGGSIVNMHADEVRVIVDAATEAHELDQYAARWRCDHYLVQPRSRDDVAHAAQLVAQRPRWRFIVDLREAVALPAQLSAINTKLDLQPGAEAETTLLA